MLTQEDISNYNKLHSEICKRAEDVLSIYKKIRDETFGENFPKGDGIFSSELYSVDHVSFQEIDGESVTFTGDEYWSYGGHQAHLVNLPLSYLTANNIILENILRVKFREIKEEEQRKQELKAKLDEVAEKAMFEKLREKYEK